MASSRPDNKETTLYSRHGKHGGKTPKNKRIRVATHKPKRPVEQVMPIIMLAVSIVFLAHAGFRTGEYDSSHPDRFGRCGSGFRRRSGLDIFRWLASEFTGSLNLKHFLVILELATFT